MKRFLGLVLEFLFITLIGFPFAICLWLIVSIGFELFTFVNFLIKLKNGISRKIKKR